jgi:nitrogen PTS system EIIA component
MHLASYLDARTISFEQRILTKEQVYQQLVDSVCSYYKLPVCGIELLDLIIKRDQEATTAYPTGIAIPHIRMDGYKDTVIGMTFLQNPIAINGTMVSWVVLIITDMTSSKLYLNIVAALLGLSQNADTMKELASGQTGQGLIHLLKQMNVEVKKDLTISDIMIKNPVSIRPQAFLSDMSAVMNECEVSVIPVTDEQGKYLGEVNILNFLKVGVPNFLMMIDNLNFLLSFEPLENLFEKQNEVRVREIMLTDEACLSPSASIIEAVRDMIKLDRRYMSVVENGKLVGVVTAMDIFRKVIKA